MILPHDVGETLRPQPVGERVRRLSLEQRAHPDRLHGGERAQHHPPDKRSVGRLRLLDGHYGHAIAAQTDALTRLHLQNPFTCHLLPDAARNNASPDQVILHRDRP